MKFTFRLFLFALTLLLATACASLAQDITPPPNYSYVPPLPTQKLMDFPSVPPDPVAGQAIYVEKCQPCHGEQGLGNGPDANKLPNAVIPIGAPEIARQASPGAWFRVVTEGRIERYMPPFVSLTERQRWDVLAYAMTLSVPEETLELGQKLFQANCASCHGENGLGDGAEAVNYGRGVPSFANQLLMAERSKADFLTGMTHPNLPEIPNVMIGLTASDRWAITDYLRSLTFAARDDEITFQNPLVPSENAEEPSLEAGSLALEQMPEELADSLGQGLISGQIVNLSGGDVPADQEVVLRGFDQYQEVISVTTKVQENGLFRFEQLEIPEGRAFIVTARYNGTTFTSDVAVVEAGVKEYNLPVSIYETTTRTDGLVIDRLHVLFEFTAANQVRVAELIIISNLSNQVVVSADENTPVMTFTLPKGATNLQFQAGALGRDFIQTPDGFGDMRSVIPGNTRHQVLFSFDMPYERSLTISQPMNLPVQNLIVLAPSIGVTLTGEGLVSGGVQDVQGTPYEVFTGDLIPSGQNLTLNLSGRPNLGNAGVVQAGSSANLAIGLGALGVAILGAGVWLFRQSNRQHPAREMLDESSETVDPSLGGMDSEELMDAIITLDDYFSTGKLPEEAYLQRRAVLKEALRKKVSG